MKILLKNVLLIISMGIIYIATAGAESENFRILQDTRQVGPILNFHSVFLGMGLRYPKTEIVPFWLRMPEIKTPGDYFRHPAGADSVQLTPVDISEIANNLKGNIREQFYDSYVLDSLMGFEYELREGEVFRREFYVKYGRGDTIYVISGILGKFISFYRAIPGKNRLSFDELQTETAILSTVETNKDDFIEKENEHIYFREVIDREKKARVRNYQIITQWPDYDKTRDDPDGKYYNLIEITRFLDDEAMP